MTSSIMIILSHFSQLVSSGTAERYISDLSVLKQEMDNYLRAFDYKLDQYRTLSNATVKML